MSEPEKNDTYGLTVPIPDWAERIEIEFKRKEEPEPPPEPKRTLTMWGCLKPEATPEGTIIQGGWRAYDLEIQAAKMKAIGRPYQAYVSNDAMLNIDWDNIPSIMAASEGPWTEAEMLTLKEQVPEHVLTAFPERLAKIASQDFVQIWCRCNPSLPDTPDWAWQSPYSMFGAVHRAKFHGRIVKAGPQLWNRITGMAEAPAMVEFAIRGAFAAGANGIVLWGEKKGIEVDYGLIMSCFDEPVKTRPATWGIYEPFLPPRDGIFWEIVYGLDFELFDDISKSGNYAHVLIPVLHENTWLDWEKEAYKHYIAQRIATVEMLIPGLETGKLREALAKLADLQARIPYMDEHDWPVSCSLETRPAGDIWTECSEPGPYGGHHSIRPVSRIPDWAHVLRSASETQWKPTYGTRDRLNVQRVLAAMPDTAEEA